MRVPGLCVARDLDPGWVGGLPWPEVITGKLLHSVSYAGLWGQAFLPVDQFVEKAAELGFDGVMLMAKRPHVSVLDYGEKQRARLRSLLEKKGLEKVCIAGYSNLTADLEHGEIPHREFQIQHITELARLARDLGGNVVRVFTGYENPAADLTRQWRLIVDTLRECAERAAEFGVLIGIQNHHDIAVGYESMHDLLGQIGHPNARALFDAWAPALHGVDLLAAAKLMGPLTVHTTVADYVLRPRFKYQPALIHYEVQTPSVLAVPMGEGFIPYGRFFEAMNENGFEGTVAYEMCSPLRDGGTVEVLDGYARRFIEYFAD